MSDFADIHDRLAALTPAEAAVLVPEYERAEDISGQLADHYARRLDDLSGDRLRAAEQDLSAALSRQVAWADLAEAARVKAGL